jgi:hypothetical protein
MNHDESESSAHTLSRRPSLFTNFAGFAGQLWLGQFLGAIYACLVGNLVFGIALESVVNVQLALQIALPFLLIFLYVAVSIFVRDFSDVLDFLTSVLAYALTPFAATLGFMIYGHFAHVALAERSFVYGGVVRHMNDTLIAIANLGSQLSIPHIQLIATPQFFNWSNFIFAGFGLLLSAAKWVANRREQANRR